MEFINLLLLIICNFIANNSESIFNSLATLFAAFIGAWFAFRLQNKNDLNKEESIKHLSGNKVLFQLMDEINWLHNLQDQQINPYRTDPARMFRMKPDISMPPESAMDIECLSFILLTKHADLLGKLAIERRKFEQAVQIQKRRSTFYLEDIYPVLEKGGIKHGQDMDEQELRNLLGDQKWMLLESLTNHLIEQVDQTISSHTNMASELQSALTITMPKRKFIKFSIIDAIETSSKDSVNNTN